MEPRGHGPITSFGLLILRLGIGGLMMTHGWGKVQMVMAGDFKFADPIKIGAKNSLILTALAEFVCAGLVVIGLATRLAAIGPVIAMSVAAFIFHQNDPWFSTGAGQSKEPALLFLTGFLTLVFTGPGRYSFDSTMWGRRTATPGLGSR